MNDVTTEHRVCTLATCNLNQWSMDFTGNLGRICLSIKQVRVGARRPWRSRGPRPCKSPVADNHIVREGAERGRN
jgi:hypothetical protein